jgi:hypothetical protein
MGRAYLRYFILNSFDKPINPIRHSMDRNGIVTLFLIGNNLEIFADEVLEKEFGWGMPKRATIPARKYNPKYADIA